MQKILLLISCIACLTACKQTETAKQQENGFLFETLTADKTGLHFTNSLTPTSEFNMFNYMYFYNGAGVGAADFNKDGLIDLFFAGNQQRNRIFINKGNLTFEDVTIAANIPDDGAWSTGVSVTDVNNDSLPDIYVCRASNYEVLKGKNQLLVCQGIKNGIPYFKDEAAKYGVDFAGLSTQAAFFDFDLDNDLDMFLMNHAPSHVGRFAERSLFLNTYDSITGDRLYRNDGNHFTDVTRKSGINSSAIGYGLGIAVSDINLDGWPDIYVGNDFHENDYLYINAGDGTFKDEAPLRTMHTSQFTMGVDIADATNDGYPEIISMDMLPADHYMQKRSLGEDTYDIFKMKLRYGYHAFFTRNNLQLNRRNNFFSETGLYSGIAATDWSWSCLWTDFDNDGWKDLFISNGIPKRLNDIDWVNFISQDQMQEKLKTGHLSDSDFAVINKFPEIKLPNYFFRNKGNATFEKQSAGIKNNLPTFSNGAVYSDLDNDGDEDVVVNNIADAVLVYENKLADPERKQSATIQLHGPAGNTTGEGSKIILFAGKEIRSYEKMTVHGYMSSMQGPIHIGLGHTKIDSAFLIWPDRTFEKITIKAGANQDFNWRQGLPRFNFDIITHFQQNTSYPLVDITQQVGLHYAHTENLFQEFNREQLIPQMTSTEGPALAVADVNGDGLDDAFFGSARGFKNALFVQQSNGTFTKSNQPALDADSTCEDVDACFADINGDSFQDLIIASGGNEFYGTSPFTAPRAYLNDGKGNFTRKADAFPAVFLNASCVVAEDFNKDGSADLFIGGRCVPFAYGITPQSFLLQNNGKGQYADVTAKLAPALQNAGLVKDALWKDIDNNGSADLILACQWQPLLAFINNNGQFKKQQLTPDKGWWNFTLPIDANSDGKLDFIAGNMGLNNRITASKNEPLRMYVTDMDANGTTEQILTYYLDTKEVPFAGKDELQKQLPVLKKKFLYAEDFAKASLEDIFTASALKKAVKLEAEQLSNALFINKGNGTFALQPLPWMAQLSPYNDGIVVNANNDNLPDVLLAGNFYDNTIQLGRNDADFGMLLINKGNGNFDCENLAGVSITGESRKIKPIRIKGRQAIIIARNNASAMVIVFDTLRK